MRVRLAFNAFKLQFRLEQPEKLFQTWLTKKKTHGCVCARHLWLATLCNNKNLFTKHNFGVEHGYEIAAQLNKNKLKSAISRVEK